METLNAILIDLGKLALLAAAWALIVWVKELIELKAMSAKEIERLKNYWLDQMDSVRKQAKTMAASNENYKKQIEVYISQNKHMYDSDETIHRLNVRISNLIKSIEFKDSLLKDYTKSLLESIEKNNLKYERGREEGKEFIQGKIRRLVAKHKASPWTPEEKKFMSSMGL